MLLLQLLPPLHLALLLQKVQAGCRCCWKRGLQTRRAWPLTVCPPCWPSCQQPPPRAEPQMQTLPLQALLLLLLLLLLSVYPLLPSLRLLQH